VRREREREKRTVPGDTNEWVGGGQGDQSGFGLPGLMGGESENGEEGDGGGG
jgi:hypothetical protein